MLKTLKMALKHTAITLPYILLRNKYFYRTDRTRLFLVKILFSEKQTGRPASESKPSTMVTGLGI